MSTIKAFYNEIDFQNQPPHNLKIDVNINGNSISNIEVADFASNVIDTDIALAANSDIRIPTQKAIKTYIDGLLGSSDALVFKGGLDASGTNTLPGANAGDSYKITVSGNFNGTSNNLPIGTLVICTTDSTASNTPSNWLFLQNDLELASDTIPGIVEKATQIEVDAESDDIRYVTPLTLANYITSKGITSVYRTSFLTTDWVGVSVPFSLVYANTTHGLGIENSYDVVVFNSSHDEVGIKYNVNAGTITIYSNIKFDGNILIS